MKYGLKAKRRQENMGWENASKTNNDFVPFVACENLENQPMAGVVVRGVKKRSRSHETVVE